MIYIYIATMHMYIYVCTHMHTYTTGVQCVNSQKLDQCSGLVKRTEGRSNSLNSKMYACPTQFSYIHTITANTHVHSYLKHMNYKLYQTCLQDVSMTTCFLLWQTFASNSYRHASITIIINQALLLHVFSIILYHL